MSNVDNRQTLHRALQLHQAGKPGEAAHLYRQLHQDFNGVLPKGTPVAQCIPVKRETWVAGFEMLSGEDNKRLIETREAIRRETDVYRHQFRAPKR